MIETYFEQSGLIPCPSGPVCRDSFSAEIDSVLSGGRSSPHVRKTVHGPIDPEISRGAAAYALHVDNRGMCLDHGEYTGHRWHMRNLGTWARIPDIEKAESSEAFFDAVAKQLAPFLTKQYRLGVCLACPLETGEDGRTVMHSPPHAAAGNDLEGRCPEEELGAALRRAGVDVPGTIRAVGEAEAVLLSGRLLPPTSPCNTIALFMGSGGQVAYFASDAGAGPQTVITVYADKYADLRGAAEQHDFPLDATLGTYVLKEAQRAARQGFFTASAARQIRQTHTILTQGLCSWMQSLPAEPTMDEKLMLSIAKNLIHRVGQRMGACVSSALGHVLRNQKQPDLFLIVEGSVFSASRILRDNLSSEIDRFRGEADPCCWLGQVDRSVLVGTAYAAMEKNAPHP